MEHSFSGESEADRLICNFYRRTRPLSISAHRWRTNINLHLLPLHRRSPFYLLTNAPSTTDWYLTVRDNYWCDSAPLDRRASSSSNSNSNNLPNTPPNDGSAAASNTEMVTLAPPQQTSAELRMHQHSVSRSQFDGRLPQEQRTPTYSATRITPSIQTVPNNHRPISDATNGLVGAAGTAAITGAAAPASTSGDLPSTPVEHQHTGVQLQSPPEHSKAVSLEAVVSGAAA